MNSEPLKKKTSERIARLIVLALVVGLPLAAVLARNLPAKGPLRVIEIHARMPENGGWSPPDFRMQAGETVRLRLVSDDVLHSFAIGQQAEPVVELEPGKTQEVLLSFDRPGRYTYYCTRWCGVNHWRMRGAIEVIGSDGSRAQPGPADSPAAPPLYLGLGLDLDAPHLARVTPAVRPSAARGEALELRLPDHYRSQAFFRSNSPVEIWELLRLDPLSEGLSDDQVWDLVALIWAENTSPERLATGQALYAQNCAACHGEGGAGDGVMARYLQDQAALGAGADEMGHMPGMGAGDEGIDGRHLSSPTAFTDPESALGASPALLHGKIIRGGMGTGMPYWGPVLTDEQIWSIVEYLLSFQFEGF